MTPAQAHQVADHLDVEAAWYRQQATRCEHGCWCQLLEAMAADRNDRALRLRAGQGAAA